MTTVKQETEVTRDWLIDLLSKQEATVTFIKKDGSERVMKCTLEASKVQYEEKKTERNKAANPETLPVYDLEAKGWRSFRIDSIKHVEFGL